MRQTDIAIVGGGLAGSIAAAMLGRDGCEVVLIDPHTVYPPDFRCEKLDPGQVLLLEKTGLAGPVLRATTRDEHVWVARFGRLVEKRRNNQYDFLYDTLVNKVRAEIPIGVDRIRAKVLSIATSSERQQLKLSTGAEVSARLVVLANGLNIGLRHSLGLEREVLSACHSISIGFDMRPIGRPSFDFRALTYYSERITDRVAYLALFPIGSAMRANFFIYRNLDDPWLQEFREAPASTLLRSLPGLRKLTGDFEIADPVRIRPVDLYRTTGYQQPGIVVVGDAFATSCPAAGTGASKVLTDAERLCHVHIPRWLASSGTGVDKISSFYEDAVKQACDAQSLAKAYRLRALSLEPGSMWKGRRWARFVGQLGRGKILNTLAWRGAEAIRQPNLNSFGNS